MRFQALLVASILTLRANPASGYVPAKTPNDTNRHWASGTIAVKLTGPTSVDGHAVHDGVRSAIASWNAIAHARISLTATEATDRREPAIGNGRSEFGWVESSDSPYFIPGVPCTTASIYDTLTGLIVEADTTCNAMAFQWPDGLFGLYTQDGVADAETQALAAFGSWLGLDASLRYGDPMTPLTPPGGVLRTLSDDDSAFVRHQYGDGTSSNGSIAGTVRFANGSPVSYAYVAAFDAGGREAFGAVTSVAGAFTIFELPAGSYVLIARPMTTDPYILSSVPYRANAISQLDFSPAYYAGGGVVQVADGVAVTDVDITVSRTGSQPDPYEPDGSASAASPLTVGFSKLATTHAVGDVDWFWFQTVPGNCYVVATGFHGASTVPRPTPEEFWSRTRISLYDGANLVDWNESRDELQLDPGNWLTYCESGSGRRLDLEVSQRESVGGAGYFYTVFATVVPGGSSLTPSIAGLYPSSGWSTRNRFVWLDGADFMPGARVDIRLPGGTWVGASQVVTGRCDATYRCAALEALFPTATPGIADVRVTNPNGSSVTKPAAFTYLDSGSGPVSDRTPQVFGTRYGSGRAVCVGDYDGDGNDDILKTRNGGLPHQLFRSNADGTFSDVAPSAGLHAYSTVFGNSCSFVDVDDDGDLDAYVTNVAYDLYSGSANELYVNQLAGGGGPVFALSTPAGLGGAPTRYKSDAAWADFNDDGRLDVVIAYDSYAGSAPYGEAVQLFRQEANGAFTDVTASSGLAGYFATVTSVIAADLDNDGCEDLVFFTNAGFANRAYRGNCRGTFTDITSASHLAQGSPWCTGAAVADFNNDGAPDIFCGSYNTGSGPVRPRLWLNNGTASFTDRALDAGLYGVARNMDVVLPLDEDNDGLVDVYIGASERGAVDDRKDVLLRNTGGNPPVFVDVTDAAGMYPTTQDGSGICSAGVDEFFCDRDAAAGGVLDWGQDGALDVFVTGSDPDFLQRGSDFFWDNRRNILVDGSVAPANDWIEVALKGANTTESRVLSNRLGIGARVTIVPSFHLPSGAVPTEIQCLQNPLPAGVTGASREVRVGNRSQSSTVLHFGLGNALPFGRKVVDCIRVDWPSGLTRAYTGITADTKVVLAEDEGRVKVVNVIPNSGPNTRSDPTTITGMRFDRDVTSVPQVFFGAVPATSVTFVSEHELNVLPPLWQPPGVVDVTVVNTDGECDTLLAGYTYTGSSDAIHFKDPFPSMLDANGAVPNDPSFVASRGAERTGVIADGTTQLVFEAEVAGSGQVRFVLDDDDVPGNAPPPATSVGTMTALSGGAPQTILAVPVVALTDGRHVAHAVFTAPQDFIRTPADNPLAARPIRVRATFTNASNVTLPMPTRTLDLYRVPVLYVHGMWGTDTSFSWPVMDDPRWIVYRADYTATNDLSFAENAGVPPRSTAELRRRINDVGIAGTRFVVIAHSMGALLFKIFLGGAGAPYARADNFFAGDVYALVPVDAPFFGSEFASFIRRLSSLPELGPKFVEWMDARGRAVDRGGIDSLEAGGAAILDVPAAVGTFHAIVGRGGAAVRNAGVEVLGESGLGLLARGLALFNAGFDDDVLSCPTGDDLIVCVDSQLGGLATGYVDAFDYVDTSAMAIHFDSICREQSPSAAVERLLNTPSTTSTAWASVLPKAPPPAAPEPPVPSGGSGTAAPLAATANDGFALTLAKQGDGVALSWSGSATRMLKSFLPTLAAGVCLAVTGSGATDVHALAAPAPTYYAVGGASLCATASGLSVASTSPATGSAMGGYAITILGNGFDAGARVRIGSFYASEVVVVNATTISCRMPPGAPGPIAVTVVNGAGSSASTTFTFVDPGPVLGGVTITAPADGAVVTAGSTLTISAAGFGGFVIAKALGTSRAFASDDDADAGPDFLTTVQVPADVIGPLTIYVLAKDASSNVKSAAPVTVNVTVPGNVALVRLDAEKTTLLAAHRTRQLNVFGVYSDGIRRQLTNVPGIAYEMETQDPRKPNYPYNGTGVAIVDATGTITAKNQGSALCHVTYSGRSIDVVVEIAGIRPTVTLQQPGFISWPYQGSGITYDIVRGKLGALRASGGNFADPAIGLTCLKDNFVNVTAADAQTPAVGDAYFYLVRDSLTRSYDESPSWPTRSQTGSRTAEIGLAPGSCP